MEKLAVLGAEKMRADGARHVAAVARVFDFDDLGALIGQIHGAERAGAILFNREDADP